MGCSGSNGLVDWGFRVMLYYKLSHHTHCTFKGFFKSYSFKVSFNVSL